MNFLKRLEIKCKTTKEIFHYWWPVSSGNGGRVYKSKCGKRVPLTDSDPKSWKKVNCPKCLALKNRTP